MACARAATVKCVSASVVYGLERLAFRKLVMSHNSLAKKGVEELVEKVCTGELPVHNLEKQLGDCEKAVRVRRGWLQRETGSAPTTLPYEGFDYEKIPAD